MSTQKLATQETCPRCNTTLKEGERFSVLGEARLPEPPVWIGPELPGAIYRIGGRTPALVFCRDCGEKFGKDEFGVIDMKAVAEWMQAHYAEIPAKRRPFKCFKCKSPNGEPLESESWEDFEAHANSSHPEIPKPHWCFDCTEGITEAEKVSGEHTCMAEGCGTRWVVVKVDDGWGIKR